MKMIVAACHSTLFLAEYHSRHGSTTIRGIELQEKE